MITDVGMCGSSSGIIGASTNFVIKKFISGRPTKFELSDGEPIINAVFIETKDDSVVSKSISRINQKLF